MASKPPGKQGENAREARLKAALKANMAKRKQQARARRGGEAITQEAPKAGKDKQNG